MEVVRSDEEAIVVAVKEEEHRSALVFTQMEAFVGLELRSRGLIQKHFHGPRSANVHDVGRAVRRCGVRHWGTKRRAEREHEETWYGGFEARLLTPNTHGVKFGAHHFITEWVTAWWLGLKWVCLGVQQGLVAWPDDRNYIDVQAGMEKDRPWGLSKVEAGARLHDTAKACHGRSWQHLLRLVELRMTMEQIAMLDSAARLMPISGPGFFGVCLPVIKELASYEQEFDWPVAITDRRPRNLGSKYPGPKRLSHGM